MINLWLYTLLSVFVVSLFSFIGVVFLAFKKDFLKKIVLILVSLSAGALLGGAFFHLIPEIIEECGCNLIVSFSAISGIVFFFVLEKFIKWHHCHDIECEHHSFAYMNLIGDGFHNLIDGLVIAASYLHSTALGISTTIAVLFHEIPQEIGDFGVLIHGGFSRFKALIFNFFSALTAVLGAVIGLLISSRIENFTMYLLPFTAGGFIYIAATDLLPELHKEQSFSKSLLQLISLLIGIGLMFSLTFLEL